MKCCDLHGDCNQGRDCPARVALYKPAAHQPASAAEATTRPAPWGQRDPHDDPHGQRGNEALWELAESTALVLFILIAVCGIAGFVYARFGADIELALWRVADAAWALAGGAS